MELAPAEEVILHLDRGPAIVRGFCCISGANFGCLILHAILHAGNQSWVMSAMESAMSHLRQSPLDLRGCNKAASEL
jgi:hypothetical protein